MAEELEAIALDDFAARINGVLDKMKATYKELDDIIKKMDKWAEGRRAYEEHFEICGCVSDTMEDLVDLFQVTKHFLQSYGTMISNAGKEVLDHKDRKQITELVSKAVEVMENLPEEIKSKLTRQHSNDKDKMN